jgi:ribosomal protein S18 acetylase RimI-like enzyme
MYDVYVREALLNDCQNMIDLQKNSVFESYLPFMDEQTLATWLESGAIENYIFENYSRSLVAEIDGDIVGFIFILDDYVIDLLWVDLNQRKKGIASHLIGNAEFKIKDKNYKEAVVEVYEDNVPAYNMYKQNGYEVTKRFTDRLNGLVKVVFEKKLK